MAGLNFLIWPTIAGLLAALLILDRWVLPATSERDPSRYEVVSYANAVRSATPAVVNIYTAKLVNSRPRPLLEDLSFRQFARPAQQYPRIEDSLGSGVIMTSEGHILTNNHVIAGAVSIQVLLQNGRYAEAVVIGTDTATDLAVLKVDLPGLQPISLGDSNAARVGDVVLAIGNPLGFGHSVSQGIVSALGRYGLQRTVYEDYIQTDATIHRGNSGGALIDTRGRLLGINTLIYTDNSQGRNIATGSIGLAIPVNLAVFVMQDLIDYGEVIRGWLGVSVKPLGIALDEDENIRALEVVDVAGNSPAQKAGVMPGDLITHINGEPVRDGRLAMHRIALLRPGDSVDIALLRGQQSLELTAIVGILNQTGG